MHMYVYTLYIARYHREGNSDRDNWRIYYKNMFGEIKFSKFVLLSSFILIIA